MSIYSNRGESPPDDLHAGSGRYDCEQEYEPPVGEEHIDENGEEGERAGVKRRRRSAFMVLIDIFMTFVTIAAAVALTASYLAQYVNPGEVWYFAFFGLFAPIIYITNVVISIYWALRLSPVFFFCAAMLLAGAGKVPEIYKFSAGSGKIPDEIVQGKKIKVFSFNVECFEAQDDDKKSYCSAKEIAGYLRGEAPDIVCFQEFQPSAGCSVSEINRMMSDWQYRVIDDDINIAIYSKLPILSHNTFHFDRSSNGFITAELSTGRGGKLRIVNNHLETSHVTRKSVILLESLELSRVEEKRGEIIDIGRRLKRGFTNRALQADSVAAVIAAKDMPTIICGDFNDTPWSYTYKTIRGDFDDAFEEMGSGLGFTYKRLYKVLRIDYILHSTDIATLSYESPGVRWSDHNPVAATLELK